MSKHKIFISPGHNEFTWDKYKSKGGNFKDGVYEEFNTNIAIANKLNAKLQAYKKYLDIRQLEYDNNKVDMGLTDRINYINKHGHEENDLVVSLHANYNDNYEIDGQWGFYVSKLGLEFLNIYMKNVQNSLIKYTRTYKCVKNTWTSLGIVLKTIPPAVLLEFGFFSNKEDRNILKSPSYHEYCAQKVMLSILQYFNIKKIQTPIDLSWEKHLEKTAYPEQWKNNIKKAVEICNKYDMGDLDFIRHLPDLIETIANKK